MKAADVAIIIGVLIVGSALLGALAGTVNRAVNPPTPIVDRPSPAPSGLWRKGPPPKDVLVVGIFDDDYGRPGEVFDRWAAYGRWTGKQFVHSYNDDRGKMIYVVANRPPARWAYAPAGAL